MRRSPKGIGLAIVGAGRVGLFRGAVAARHPAVEWIGLAEINPERGQRIGAEIGADFITTDHRELLRRPEVTRPTSICMSTRSWPRWSGNCRC